jgi:hypothetical protein
MSTETGKAWAGLERELALVLGLFEEDQFLILQQQRTGRYVQIYVSEPGSLHVEVSSNAFLRKDGALTDQEIAVLLAQGWRPPSKGGAPNFSTDLRGPKATAEAARLTVKTLAEVLGAGSPAELEYDAYQHRGGQLTLPPLRLPRLAQARQ